MNRRLANVSSDQQNHVFSFRTARVMVVLALGFFLLAMSGCGASRNAPLKSGLSITPAAMVERLTTVCPFATISEVDLGDEEQTAAKLKEIDVFLAEQLQGIGLTVRETEEVEERLDASRQAIGGYYDPHWGRTIESRRLAALVKFYELIHEELGCDAVARPRVVVAEAAYWSNGARWDRRSLSHGYPVVGWFPASSFQIVLLDAPEREIYFGVGGIELQVERASSESADFFDEVEPADRLSKGRDRRAGVRLALGELREAFGFSADDGRREKRVSGNRRR